MPSKSYPVTRSGPVFNANRSSHRSTFSCPLPTMTVCEHDDEDNNNMKSSCGVQVEHNEHATTTTTNALYDDENETFGDVLSRSISGFHRHQLRMHSYRRQVEAWENRAQDRYVRRMIIYSKNTVVLIL